MDNIEDYKLRKVIHDYVKEVCHYSQKQVFANSSYQKNYFQMQIDEATTGLINFLQLYYNYNGRKSAYPAEGDEVLVEQSSDQQPGIGSSITTSVQQHLPSGNQPENTAETGSLREFTVQELSQYNGKNGNPAYVAVNGIVYDLSNVERWAGGSHFGLNAGQDHTKEFADCHLGMTERLQGLPVVGILLPS